MYSQIVEHPAGSQSTEQPDSYTNVTDATPPSPLAPDPILISLKPTRTGRTRFLPSRLRDNLPSLSRSMPGTFEMLCKPKTPPPTPDPPLASSPEPSPSPEPPAPMTYISTEPDDFGIYRSYPELPNSIPDEEVSMADVCEGAGFPVVPPSNPLSVFGLATQALHDNIIAPFMNVTVFRLMAWFHNKSQTKSIADLDRLVKEVILPDDFRQDHLKGFSTQKVLKDVDNFGGPRYTLQPADGWIEGSVKIPVPCTGVQQSEADAPLYEVKNIYYRKPLEVIKAVFQSEQSQKFHYTPFKLFRKQPSPACPDLNSIRLHSELYNSDAFLDEHEKVQRQRSDRYQQNPDDPLLRVPTALAGMMFWSDATKVGTWGDESMWPIYLYFGNQSKYDRAKPSSFAAHHLAYIPKVCIQSFH